MEGNIAFRAVYIPDGNHIVEFRYEPPLLKLSLIISLIGFVVCILLYKKREKDKLDATINYWKKI